MPALTADIKGNWKSKTVWINGKEITFSRFLRDLKPDEKEPGENKDIIEECEGVMRFSWGDTSQATSSLSLACCFYLDVDWVMCRFFMKELANIRRADMELVYDENQLLAGFEQSEKLFANDFTEFMDQIGAKRVDEK